MGNVIKIGMAELNVVKAPDSILTSGLGSCVGVCLNDPTAKVGGMAHVMLPDSTSGRQAENPSKYADTAIPILIDKIQKAGGVKRRLVAKIAGGAQMFSFYNASDVMKIGDRNVEAVLNILKENNIKVLVNETGGNFGRTIEFFPENGSLYIRTINQGEKLT